MKRPRNTGEQDPAEFLAEAMMLGTSGAVEKQEAEGQESFCASDTLPKQFIPEEGRGKLEALGVEFLDSVDGDDLFQYVRLPDGWKKKATDHSMWSQLLDENGKEVANIFYKAAFYDRKAHVCVPD